MSAITKNRYFTRKFSHHRSCLYLMWLFWGRGRIFLFQQLNHTGIKPRATGSVTIHGGKLALGFVFEPNLTTAQRLLQSVKLLCGKQQHEKINQLQIISGTVGLCLRREERTRTRVPVGLVLLGMFPHGCNVKPMGQAERPGLPRTIETSHRTCCQSMRNFLQMLVSCSLLVFPEQCGKRKAEKEKRK